MDLTMQVSVMRETSGWLVAIQCMKVEWRSATTTYGALSVMTLLQGLTVRLFVGNLDLVMQVGLLQQSMANFVLCPLINTEISLL